MEGKLWGDQNPQKIDWGRSENNCCVLYGQLTPAERKQFRKVAANFEWQLEAILLVIQQT